MTGTPQRHPDRQALTLAARTVEHIGGPMGDQDRVTETEWPTIAQFGTRAEGEVAVSALSAADVPCKLVVDHTEPPGPQGIDPNLDQATSGVQLCVPPQQVDEALALLASGGE